MFPRRCITSQVTIEVTASTQVITPPADARIVVTSMMLSAAGAVLVEFYEGTAGAPEGARLTGQMQLASGQPIHHNVNTDDAVFRLSPERGLTIKPLAAVVVAGTLSYYLERV